MLRFYQAFKKLLNKRHSANESHVRIDFSKRVDYWDFLNKEDNSGKIVAEKFFTRFELKRRKEIVLDFFLRNNELGIKVLDLGCGIGVYFNSLSQMGYDTIGVDISTKMLYSIQKKTLENHNNKWKLVCSDCISLPFPDQYFDKIICVGVLEYLSDINQSQALSEIRRVIKPEGVAIITFPNFFKLRNLLNPYYYFVRFWTYYYPDLKSKDIFNKNTVNRYSLIKIRHLFSNYGFKITNVDACCFGPFEFWKKTIFSSRTSQRFSNSLEKLSKNLSFLVFLANEWIVVAKKSNNV